MLRRLKDWLENTSRSETQREEMELDLAEKAEELEADGLTAERARAEARRRFGNVGLKHEESRERAKLPALSVNPGPVGLGSLRREYSKPLFLDTAHFATETHVVKNRTHHAEVLG